MTTDQPVTGLVQLGAEVEVPRGDPMAVTGPHQSTRAPGRLDELAGWLAALQGTAQPREAARALVMVFGGQPCTPDVAELAGAATRRVDVPAAGSDPVTVGIATGAAMADAEVDAGADLFVVAVPDADVSAAVIVSVLTNTEPVKVVPKGAWLPAEEWMAQVVAVRDARRRAFAHQDHPDELLAALGAPALAAATGFLLRAAARRTPLILDGVGASAAALIAHLAQPRVVAWVQAADDGAHPSHDLALARLGLRPLLCLGIAAADGTAGALALVALRAAVRSPRVPISS